MVNSNRKPGFYTETEILSQPNQWVESLCGFDMNPQVEKITRDYSGSRRWLFVGCGSSYYVAMAAAASWKALTGLPVQALPASELLLFPELILDQDAMPCPVLISRSGTTSEVLKAAESLNGKGIPFLAVTCTAGEKLEKMAPATLWPSAASEQSTVMTLSFSSMLIAIQYLAANFAGNAHFLDSLRRMPEGLDAWVEKFSPAVKSFVESHDFADYAWLGQGPCYGLACEGALKINEMSLSYTQSFHTLEFRHGPKSIVGPETLIMFQLSAAGFEQERGVLEEVKRLGGTTLAVTHKADERVRRAADLVVELPREGDEYASLAPRIIPAQLLGLYTGLKKGLDPDNPRNLSRAVILKD